MRAVIFVLVLGHVLVLLVKTRLIQSVLFSINYHHGPFLSIHSANMKNLGLRGFEPMTLRLCSTCSTKSAVKPAGRLFGFQVIAWKR